MLVCRDLEKAKSDFGFVVLADTQDGQLKREIIQDFYCHIDKDSTLRFEAWDCYNTEKINLDFLYDMIKDGVIEKVEE